jgi:geranylgeranyl pyrophosphate synthase
LSRDSSVPPPVTAVLDAGQAWLPSRLGEVESLLGKIAADHGPRLASDAGATLSAGGKRLRPLLVLLCAGADGSEAAVRAAAAIELVHMATLVHDDVLDDAPLRRGRPTVVATSGRDRATSTGDLLFSRAFALLAGAGDGRAVELLSAASIGLALGELAQRRDAYDTGISEERYLERCRLKTARLFECACLMGLAARAPADGDGAVPSQEEALRAFGAEIGLAFQLLDDVLDVSGPPERTGKARGTDLLDGTVTLPLILAIERDPTLASLELRSITPPEAEAACDRIAATGALEQVRDRALGMVESAKQRLEAGEFGGEQRRLLGLVADGVVQRYS